jgi:predicted NUDIX family NTP pyrophosphohydrolase
VKKSAGLLMFRRVAGGAIEVLLAHPGGPFWQRKDAGAWTLPKGEYEEPEEPLAAALREWNEETGFEARPPFLPLGEVTQKNGKRVLAWAFEGDCEPQQLKCNTFEIEWPPKSGRRQSFPEIDRVQWFGLAEAREKINPAQAAFLDRLAATPHASHRGPGRA